MDFDTQEQTKSARRCFYLPNRGPEPGEWLRAVADCYRQRADRLQGQLADTHA
jgi:hypothetical protein